MTGSNKGIGLEIVRELCWLFDGDVILTGQPIQHAACLSTIIALIFPCLFAQLEMYREEWRL